MMKTHKWIGLSGVLLVLVLSIGMGQGGETAVSANDIASIHLPLIYRNHDSSLSPIFGVQIYNSTDPNHIYYDSMIGTNASWVRTPIAWTSAEPVNVPPEDYNWDAIDSRLIAARSDSGGLNFIVTMEGAPFWAAPANDGPIYPAALDDFAEFIGALVERFDGDGIDDAPGSPVVNYWEFYNEPDNNSDLASPFFSEPMRWGNHGEEYANMLAIIYPVVKAANPKAQVVLGGLALDWFESEGGPFVASFLSNVLAAGGGNYFDVMNFHSYPAFHYRWTDDLGPGLLGKAAYVREVLADYGLEKPLIITEAGWMSNDRPGASIPGSPEIQSRYVVELFTESMAADMKVMIWWMLFDPSFPYPFMNGLVTEQPDVEPKLSYYVYQNVVAELGTAHFVRALSAEEMGHPLMEAYMFFDRVFSRDLYVLWLNPVSTTETTPWQLDTPVATVRDSLTGVGVVIQDGDDGSVDGKITVYVGANPLFVEVAQ